MGYIIKKSEPLVNVKLTDKGREKLSVGQLKLTNFALSDGEMVYTNYDPALLNILRPADNQPAASYLVPSEGSNYIVPISSIVSYPQIIHSPATERGFFTGGTGNVQFIYDYMLCGGYVIPQENFLSGNTITVLYGTGTTTATTINPSGLTPSVGDLMLIKFAGTGYTGTVDGDYIGSEPIPYLWYEITGITGNASTGFTIETDRLLPHLNVTGVTTGNTGYAYFYPGGDMIRNVFDETYPYAYWSKGLLDFTDTCSNGAHDVPMWNMNVVYIMDIIGLNNLYYKGHDLTIGNDYRGLHPYLKYAEDVHQNKIGIIHYTNNTVNNYYGEGFYLDNSSFALYLPTLMWHKKQFGGPGYANSIGHTFTCDSVVQYIDHIRYQSLIDEETNVVGKVFPDLQIIVIENEELITAMSLKSNRNWSLPKPILTDIEPGNCGSVAGIITSEEELHVTYALVDRENGVTGVHCEDFTTIGTTKPNADVMFRFPYSSTDPTYSELGYFKKHSDGIGFNADDIWVILQKTVKGSKPDPKAWHYFNASAYIGSNGCVPVTIPNINDYELYSQSAFVTNVNQTTYTLDYKPIGDVIVSVSRGGTMNGLVLKEAFDLAHLYTDSGDTLCGDYIQLDQSIYFGIESGHTGTTLTNLQAGDVIQFHYLVGVTIATTTVKIDVLVPNTITSSTPIYISGVEYYIDLPTTPAGQVYMFYNGLVISQSNYTKVSGGAYIYRILFNFVPQAGSRITLLYVDNTGAATPLDLLDIQPIELNDLKVILNDQTLPIQATDIYDINLLVSIPRIGATGLTFGDETFFFGNVITDIKATIYKSIINATVLPNRFIKSTNPTFNENIHKVAFTEIDIYDDDQDVVAVGKFSQPLQRKANSDVQIINAVIDF